VARPTKKTGWTFDTDTVTKWLVSAKAGDL